AKRRGAETVFTNAVRYHDRSRRPLYDVLTSIRRVETLDEARPHLSPNSEWCLKSGRDLLPLAGNHRSSLFRTAELAQEIRLDPLNFRNVRFPGFPVPQGETPF